MVVLHSELEGKCVCVRFPPTRSTVDLNLLQYSYGCKMEMVDKTRLRFVLFVSFPIACLGTIPFLTTSAHVLLVPPSSTSVIILSFVPVDLLSAMSVRFCFSTHIPGTVRIVQKKCDHKHTNNHSRRIENSIERRRVIVGS